MEDVQNRQADIAMPIDNVGVRGIELPITVSRKNGPPCHTVATVELGVELPAEFKGTHMSRFVEALETWNEELSYKSIKNLLQDILSRLNAQKAKVICSFPFFQQKKSPVSAASGVQGYACKITGELSSEKDAKPAFKLELTVPVMTVCPCSKAISCEGAHSQRADVRMAFRFKHFLWMEELIAIAENSASSPTYPLLKREDEKFVTETAFSRPYFVEDVVRNIAGQVSQNPAVAWFRVEVESYESIHPHNAFARIERTLP
ncbi:GTP cyclohydrolase FolE2 [Desulfovibrio sp. OttesenSCG-928-G15]|nr:GTP cyclohydrolase FolE2 [Desulfovibrio sp. OttesenSCG-928-G15]